MKRKEKDPQEMTYEDALFEYTLGCPTEIDEIAAAVPTEGIDIPEDVWYIN